MITHRASRKVRHKSLTLDQAQAMRTAAEGTPMNAYIVLSLLTGVRTEELRALTWDHLDVEADPPTIMVRPSVGRGGETKTPRSRRTLDCRTGARLPCGRIAANRQRPSSRPATPGFNSVSCSARAGLDRLNAPGHAEGTRATQEWESQR